MARIIYVTGVSGVGKSTIGIALAEHLDIPFLEGDDFHPKSNIQKMSSGQALYDDDRRPWLEAINTAAKKEVSQKGAVVSCSALKEKYRTILENNIEQVIWIHLFLEKSNITDRMKKRTGHFMPIELLDSQFETYEEPKSGIRIINDAYTSVIVSRIVSSIEKN